MYNFEEIAGQQILLSFLNWGKGHLSRCIDVCRRLHKQGNTIIAACSDEDFSILHSYISSVEHISFPGYPFHFSGTGDFASDLWKSRTALNEFILWEQKEVEKLVQTRQIHLVISDHRYGFRSSSIPSIFITHQVNLALKWWQLPGQWLHKKWMKRFSYTWIMDEEHSPLAGKLSRKGNIKNASYIGHFSRFEERKAQERTIELGVCNGPYPYDRQLLEQLLRDQKLKVILSSIPGDDKRVINPGTWKTEDELFYSAKTIHSYFGYSTLMDIKRLKCNGKLIPTPGQTEQEYLHQLHGEMVNFEKH